MSTGISYHHIYEKELSVIKDYGFPIWHAHPSHPEYEVNIGDVGYMQYAAPLFLTGCIFLKSLTETEFAF